MNASDSAQLFEAARREAIVVPRPEVRTLELRGPDRLEFLDGMLSQDLRRLRAGEGTRALKCTAKGRIEAYVRVRATDESLLIDVRAEVADALLNSLASHIVMEDCTIVDISGGREVLSLLGPSSYRFLESVGLGALSPELSPDHFELVGSAMIIADSSFGLPGYELHLPIGALEKRRAALVRVGALVANAEVLEVLRVEAGEPRDGLELDLETLPMEARLERAVSLTKGCYVGQEVVARGTNLGQVNHLLVGIEFADGPPRSSPPVALSVDDRVIGEVDSVVYSETLGRYIGLGYVRREHQAPGELASYEAASGRGSAIVRALPFVHGTGFTS